MLPQWANALSRKERVQAQPFSHGVRREETFPADQASACGTGAASTRRSRWGMSGAQAAFAPLGLCRTRWSDDSRHVAFRSGTV